MALVITVNGTKHTVRARPDTPLLYVLRDELHLHGPHFGCDLGQCGACAVLLGYRQIRSCVTPVAGVVGQSITTLVRFARPVCPHARHARHRRGAPPAPAGLD